VVLCNSVPRLIVEFVGEEEIVECDMEWLGVFGEVVCQLVEAELFLMEYNNGLMKM
jgi:hypothetical protein